MTNRQLFLNHIAQTSTEPLALEIESALGCYLYDVNGKQYLDLISGISVCNIGHSHPAVVAAIQQQAAKYLHIMVYGETIQSPQVQYATWLVSHLPNTLNSVYFTNSGTEATEGAMKLAKRVTGKTDFVSCTNSYHGHTQGALSIMGSEVWKNKYRPLLPGTRLVAYNDFAILDCINNQTAAVIIEPIQAESGVTPANKYWLQAIRKKCDDTCTLLIFDEIQSGFGRTGSLWAFEHYGVVPDILLLGKALGGGMPLGAFIAHKKLMDTFTYNPVLGHLTTFGGHPISCVAGLAAAKILEEENLIKTVAAKEALFIQLLQHPKIVGVSSKGLWMAIALQNFETNIKVIQHCYAKGLFTDWFLYANNCIRVAPPLTISHQQIHDACTIILEALDVC